MKDLIKKYKKSFIVSSFIVLTLITYPLYFTVKDNFDEIVDITLNLLLADISHTKSDLSKFGVIILDDAVLKDENGITILYTPKLTLTYSIRDILRGKVISELNAKDPYLYIALDKNRDVNIVDIFSSGDSGGPKAGVNVPIDIITVSNARLLYQDNYYEKPINMFVENVDGYVSFDKEHGIDLRFYNTTGNKRVEYFFTNYEKAYSMDIKLKNWDIDQDVMQYAYVDEYTNYLGGTADLDLTVASDGLFGTAYLSNARFKTSAYDGIATNIHGGVEFLKDRIKLRLDGKMDKKDMTFSLEYQPEGVEMNITSSDLGMEELEKVTMLDDKLKKKIKNLGDFNISYLRLKFNFDSEFNLTLDNYLRPDTFHIKGAKVEELKGSIVITEDEVRLKDIRFFFDYKGNKSYTLLNGDYEKNVIDLDFSLINKKIPLNLKSLKGNLKYNLEKEKIDYTLDSPILKIGGNIDFTNELFEISSVGTEDVEVEYGGEVYSTKNDIDIVYNYKNDQLIYGVGNVEIKNKNTSEYLRLNFTSDRSKLIFNEIDLLYKELKLDSNGYLDTKDLSYNFKYKGKNLKIENFFSETNLTTGIDLQGELKGKKSSYSLITDLKGKKGYYGDDLDESSYKINYEDLSGRLRIVDNEEFSIDYDGYLGKISMGEFNFEGIKLNLDYRNNILRVLEARNNILTIEGDYNIINETIGFTYKINGIKENKVPLLEKNNLKMNLADVEGKLHGTLDDFKTEFRSKDAWIQYKDLPKMYLKGEIHYLDERLYFKGFKVDENNISGYYGIKEEDFRLKVNLLENNLSEYYGDVNLKYRLTGEIVLWGTPNYISGIFQTYADNIYLRGNKLPNIKMVSTYKGGELNKLGKSGHIDINDIRIYSENGAKLLGGNGWIDLEKERLSFKIHDSLEISDLSLYLKLEDVEGEVKSQIDIEGPFNDLKYEIKLNSELITIEENELDDLKIAIQGDLNEVNLEELSLSYHGNKLISSGHLDFNSSNYKLDIESNEIDLSFLNAFSFSKNINQIKGIATIDIELNSINSYGEFRIKDFSAEIPKYEISVDKVNTKVVLEEKKIEIKYFDGKINNGKIKLMGYLTIPSYDELKKEKEKILNLDYRLSLVLDNVDYSYKDIIKIVLSSDAIFTNNEITGDFIINSGEILGIPEIDNEEISSIASQIKEKEVVKKSKELGSKFEIKSTEKQQSPISIDIDLKTELPIKLKIESLDYTSIVKDIYGDLSINGDLKVKNDELSYNGLINIDDGSVKLNNNLFYLSIANAKFIKKENDSLDLHPLVNINANSTIANEEVYINIDGEYPNLEIQMSSGSGLTPDEIGSLLAFHNVSDESNSNVLAKDAIDSQLSGKLFSPISGEIANVLKIEKFQISSDLVAYEYEGGVYKDTGTLGLGASVEAENPIYKKLYWKAKGRWGTSKYYSNVTEYDFATEYRFTKHLSTGVGVGKLPEGRVRADESLINYHVDLSWRKKYKSFEQIMLNILLLGGKE
jgi:hypothetical protein